MDGQVTDGQRHESSSAAGLRALLLVLSVALALVFAGSSALAIAHPGSTQPTARDQDTADRPGARGAA